MHDGWTIGIEIHAHEAARHPHLKAMLVWNLGPLTRSGAITALEDDPINTGLTHEKHYSLKLSPDADKALVENALKALATAFSEAEASLEYWIDSFGPPRVYGSCREGL